MYIGEPYDPVDPKVVPLLPYYAVLSAIGMVLGIHLYLRGKEREKQEPKILGVSFLFFSGALIWAFAGLLEATIDGEYRELYRLSLPMGYSMAIVGNLFLLWFAREVFSIGKRAVAFFVVLFAITIVLINLNSNWYGTPTEVYYGKYFSIRVYSSLVLMVGSMALYFYIIMSIRKLTKKIDDPVAQAGFRIIILAFLSFVALWVCFALDAVVIQLTGEGYSVFVYLAWGFGAVFWVLSYLGLLLPDWLRKRIEARVEAARRGKRKF
ncbi:MAG: hypothetical protein ACTSU5_05165 [Promethearchaeota archaeon]